MTTEERKAQFAKDIQNELPQDYFDELDEMKNAAEYVNRKFL